MAANHSVTEFRQYPFSVGQKIHILDGKRKGDWEVVGATDAEVHLRCPVSGREFTWKRFCYVVDENVEAEWPRED